MAATFLKTDLRGLLNSFKINSNKVCLDNYINTDENQITKSSLKSIWREKNKKAYYLLKSNRKT